MILKFQYRHISSDTCGFLLYKVDLQMVVLTEGNHSHVVSSRMIAKVITSVPQSFKLDIFFACLSQALDVQKEVPFFPIQDTVSFNKGSNPCECNQKCLLYSC